MAVRDEEAQDLLADMTSGEVARAYSKLCAAVKVPKDQAAEFLGGACVVEELSRRGLARIVAATPDQAATFQPVPEAVALQTALVQFQAGILKDQERLLAGQRRLTDLQVRPGPVSTAGNSEHLVRVITDSEEIGLVSGCLVNSARKDWMTFETADTDLPVSDDNFINNPYGPQLRVRSIFDAACLRKKGFLASLRRSIETGEQVRIMRGVPMKMQLADVNAALLPLTPTGTSGAILLQGAGQVLRGIRDYFERLWAVAVPYGQARPAGGCPLSDTQMQMLELLAAGHTDQNIADLIGFSKSKVEREMDKVEEIVGLKGRRFALAVALERRGWIPRGEG